MATPRTNCTPGEPLIRLGGGEAPVLNYNLPQGSCFSAQGSIPLRVPTSWFVDGTKLEPQIHWWNLPTPEVDEIEDGLVNGVLSPVLTNWMDSRIPALLQVESAPDQVLAARKLAGAPRYTEASGRAVTPGGAEAIRVPTRRVVRAQPVYTASDVARAAVDGSRPIVKTSFGGDLQIKFLPRPPIPIPRLVVIEYYKVCSYLGDYGAGKTLSTMSLLPGEKTQITISTYRDSETSESVTQNILDSFSQSSADEVEQLVEQQIGTSVGMSNSNTLTSAVGGSVNVGAGVDLFSMIELGADVEQSASLTNTSTSTTTSELHTESINRALSSHVENSSYAREVEINTTSTTTVSEGESTSTVREIANINHSRVLNIVFRQLLQAYDTITYLDDVKVLYTNGYPESMRLIDLNQLADVLPQLIDAKHLEAVRTRILQPYCAVFNYKGTPIRFLEKVERSHFCDLTGQKEEIVYIRRRRDLHDRAGSITVPGVITNVQRNVLPTPAVIAEALLSRGDALDCYNQQLQSATVDAGDLQNQKVAQAIAIVEAIEDPQAKAEAWAMLHNPPVDAVAEPETELTP